MEINKLVKMTDMNEEYFIGVLNKESLICILDGIRMDLNILDEYESVAVRPFEDVLMPLNIYTYDEIKVLFLEGKIKMNILNKAMYRLTHYCYKKKYMVAPGSTYFKNNLIIEDISKMMVGDDSKFPLEIIPIKNIDNTEMIINNNVKIALMKKYKCDLNIEQFCNILCLNFKAVFYNDSTYKLCSEGIVFSTSELSDFNELMSLRECGGKSITFVDTENNISTFKNDGTEFKITNYIRESHMNKIIMMYTNYFINKITFNPVHYKSYTVSLKSTIYTTTVILKILENTFNKSMMFSHKIKLGKPLLFYIINLTI